MIDFLIWITVIVFLIRITVTVVLIRMRVEGRMLQESRPA
jgi:hypothetical protein